MSIGVTWTDESDAGRLDEALADCNAGIITLSSPFIAATTLAQAVAQAINSEHMAVLFVEPGSVTLAVIDAVQGRSPTSGTNRCAAPVPSRRRRS